MSENLTHKDLKKARVEPGLTLIELLIALTVMTIGMAGILPVIVGALAGNSRNKQDTTSVMLAQMVADRIRGASAGATFTIQDCLPAAALGPIDHFINTRSGPSPAAGQFATGQANVYPLTAAAPLPGTIDYTQAFAAIPAGYRMRFSTCAVAPFAGANIAGRNAFYDVRWNITQLDNATRLITVAARPEGAGIQGSLNFVPQFAIPVNLRVIVSP